MSVNYANPTSRDYIWKSQLQKLRRDFPAIWPKTFKVSEYDKLILVPRKEVYKMRRINLFPELDFLESTLLFYCDGKAEVLLTTLSKGSQEQKERMKNNERLMGSPLGVKEEHIPYIFLKEGVSVPTETRGEKFSYKYRDLFRILSEYFS